MNEELIKNELQKFNVTDAAIAKLSTDCMSLTVKTPQDMVGYEVVKKARIDIKKRRVEVEKTRVQLKAESLEYGRRVDTEAKRITSLLEPIETHLINQEKIVEDEKARIKAEAEAKEAARVQARIDRLESMGMGLIAGSYRLPYDVQGVTVPLELLRVITDEQFVQFVGEIQAKKDAEDARLEAEEKARLEEQALILKVQQEQESERQRLKAEAKKQVEEAAKIQEAQEAIEREKQRLIDAESRRLANIEREKKRIEDEKVRAEELAKVRKEAAEKALKDAEEKRKRDEDARIEKERKSREAAEKKAARAPDKTKLLSWLDSMSAVVRPLMKTDEGAELFGEILGDMTLFINSSREKAVAL